MKLSEDNWKEKLTPEQYHVLRQKGTEPPFSGKLLHNDQAGSYQCAACGNELFDSGTKFDSDTGWPSFNDVLPDAVKYSKDSSFGMERTEVSCAKCGSHLGHFFMGWPGMPQTNDFCINSCALDFKPKK